MTVIQHNIAAHNSQRIHAANNSKAAKSLQKLSTGYRINSASDDAAGLAISEKMRAQVVGLGRAELNAQDGISLLQTAEGALAEVHSMLNRLEELCVQSANDINSEVERTAIDDEIDALKEEIDRISLATQFNGMSLLNGVFSGLGRAIGGSLAGVPILTSEVSVNSGSLDSVPRDFLQKGAGPVSVTATPTGSPTHLEFSIADKDGGGSLTYTLDAASLLNMNLVGNYTLDLSPFGQLEITNGNNAPYASVNDVVEGLAAAINDMNPKLTVTPSDSPLVLQIGDQAYKFDRLEIAIEDMSSRGLGIGGLNASTAANSLNSLGLIREAIDLVSTQRGNLGAQQNRLDHAVLNLSNMGKNITEAESRVRDTDMAKEMMNFTKENILAQTSQAMLAQANTQPQQVLQLLQ